MDGDLVIDWGRVDYGGGVGGHLGGVAVHSSVVDRGGVVDGVVDRVVDQLVGPYDGGDQD